MPPLVQTSRYSLLLLLSAVVLLFAAGCGGPPAPSALEPKTTLTRAAGPGQLAAASPEPTPSGSSTASEPLWLQYPHDNDLKFERLSLQEGLSQSVVTSMIRDDQGFMWFGTQDGLNRYDGYDFVVYKHDPQDPNSLSSNFVWALHKDAAGVLWIATNGGGLDRLDRSGPPGADTATFSHYQHDPDDPNSLSSNFVQALYEDRDGVLWIGTNGGGLDRFDRQTERFSHYRNDKDPHSLGHNTIQALYEDRDGVLWIGTNGGGLDRFDRETERFTHYQHDPLDPYSLGNDDVQAIHEDRNGVLWIGTNGGGLDRFDRETERFDHFQNDPGDPHSLSGDSVQAICTDSSGALWVGTTGGLDRLAGDSAPAAGAAKFIHYRNDPNDPQSLSINQVWSLYEQEAGLLWIGTFGGGVNSLARDRNRFRHYQADPQDPRSLSGNVIWAIHEDRQGALWIGTNGGGLNRYDLETRQAVHYRNDPADPHSLGHDAVWSIHEDRQGTLWVGTGAGLDRFEPQGASGVQDGQFAHYPGPPVFAIYEDREGLLWIGTWGGGLGRLDPETGQLTFYQNDPADKQSLGDNSVLAIHQDVEGVLWLGTFSAGLNRLDPRETSGSGPLRFSRYQNDPADPQSLSHPTVLVIHEDSQGILWIGTGGGGLDRFDPQAETFRHYVEKDGLSNNTVYGILEDDVPPGEGGPHLWLSTNRGLSRFDPRTETFRNYDVGDGLQSSEFNQGSYYKGRDGQMFFGGVQGFNAFYPREVRDNLTSPPIVLTALTQGGETIAEGTAVDSLRDITFKWPNNFFEFEFAALSYAQPEKNQYAYMLEGFDSGWIEAGTRRFGRYTNLPGGTYTLRLKGSNNDGVWNENGHSLAIQIVPPFWQTWWFRGLLGLALVGGVLAGFRLQLRNVQARSRELESEIVSRTTELEAIAMENARLYEDASNRLAQLTALQETSRAVVSTLDLDELLNRIIEQATTLLQGDGGIINLVDWEEREDEVVSAIGSTASLIGQRSSLEAGLSGWVTLHNQPVITNRVQDDGRVYQPALLWMEEKQIQSAAVAPLTAKDRVMGTLVVIGRPEGKREFAQPDLDLLVAFANQAATAIENAQLLKAERRRADELEALRTTLADITAELELPALLQAIVERAAGLLDATGGELGLYDEGSQELRIVVSYNLGKDYVGTRHKLGEGAMGRVAETCESLIIDDYRAWAGGLAPYAHIRATLAAPLKAGSRLVGVFTTVTTDPDRHFTAADLHLLDLFAQQAAIAIENARLYEQARQLAVMEERQRLARDLHDSVTQALYGMALYSEAAAQELSSSQWELVSEYIGELQDTAQEAMAEMRLLIHELRPSILAEEGLVAALQARLVAVEGRAGLKTDFRVNLEESLPPETEEGLYRIAQEALNNALKHARANTIAVYLHHAPQQKMVSLDVIDDGLGFDPAVARAEGGLGLAAMAERAAELGGRMTVEKGTQGGTRLHVEVPT